MLFDLRIENLLLIERAELRFGSGLNVLTGETGAGKTVLAHSLDLLMGGKARPHIVRPGAEEAFVEGSFAVPEGMFEDPELASIAERLPDDPSEIVLGRRVGRSGRTTAFVGGRSASAGDLKLLGSRLLAFYGQHEHRKLTLASAQAEILDRFAGEVHLEVLDRYQENHALVVALTRELNQMLDREGARERDLDLMRFELDEIEQAAPDPAELEELSAERDRLRHSEGLREAASTALAAVFGGGDDGEGGAGSILAAAEGALERSAGVDGALDGLAERVGALALEASELGGELRDYLEGLEADPSRLQAIEERLDAIDRLQRKHGGSIESVLAYAERCRAEIERLETAEERGEEIRDEIDRASGLRAQLGKEVSAGRTDAARRLEQEAVAELAALAMDGASLEVVLEAHADGYGASGREHVVLKVATNPGMPAAPLRDAASGGELSRVMLALAGLARAEAQTTMVFDEIDAGVGGTTANAVGERLKRLGSERQVICITHLPQVASMAETHFQIEKVASADGALTTVERVEGEALVAEICRMLGADAADEAASRHARELLAA